MLDNTRHGYLARLIGASAVLSVVIAGCGTGIHRSGQSAQNPPSGARADPPTARVDLSASSAGARNGRELFLSLGCTGCHMVNGKGGQVGPDLSDEGGKGRSRQWLQTQIRDPKANDPQAIMPAYGTLSDEQVNGLIDYMQSLSSKGAQEGTVVQGPARPVQTVTAASLVTAGGQEWSRRCGQCHNLRPPSDYNDAQWAVAMHHMRVRVPLTGEQQRSIVAFLQAAN